MKFLASLNNVYIGTVFINELLQINYQVRRSDIYYFFFCNLTNNKNKLIRQITKDIKNITNDDFDGIDNDKNN